MDKICPRCGASSAEKKFHGSFCVNCSVERIEIQVPSKIVFERCKSCGKIWLRDWVEEDRGELEKFIISKCKGDFERARLERIDEEHAELVFVVHQGDFFEVRRSLLVEFKPVTCKECSRQHGGYYEAILQVRGKPEKVQGALKKLNRLLKRDTFIVREEELKEGVDLYVGSRQALSHALAHYNYKPTVSNKLAGLKEGKKLYRTTFCVRV